MSPSGHGFTPLFVDRGGFLPKGVGPSLGLVVVVEVMLEAVIEALHETERSLEKQRNHKTAGTLSWLFLTVLKKAIEEKGRLL